MYIILYTILIFTTDRAKSINYYNNIYNTYTRKNMMTQQTSCSPFFLQYYAYSIQNLIIGVFKYILTHFFTCEDSQVSSVWK